MAATAVWGSQQVNLFPDGKYDGVYAMWYAKGPGVDRSGDVLKPWQHPPGLRKYGGVLLVAGDDHYVPNPLPPRIKPNTPSWMPSIPVLSPGGCPGVSRSRPLRLGHERAFSGCWVGFKTIAETVESSASVYVDPHRIDRHAGIRLRLSPDGGLNIRWPDPPLDQEARLHHLTSSTPRSPSPGPTGSTGVIDSPKPRLGIVTTGKSYLDVRQALDDLGIDEALAAEIGTFGSTRSR